MSHPKRKIHEPIVVVKMSAHISEGDILEIKKRIENFLQQDFEDSKADGIIIGLSGGIDSSVTAALCVGAIGSDKVFGVSYYSPGYTKPEEIVYAEIIANRLKISHEVIDISQLKKSFKDFLPEFAKDDSSCVWIIPRIRSALTLAKANSNNLLPVSSGNKSEAELGIFMWGGDIGLCYPLRSLYKTEVRALAKVLNIQQEIQNRIPCDGLLNGLSDEGSFNADYEILDKILYQHKKYSQVEEISVKLDCDINLVRLVLERIDQNKCSLVNRPQESCFFVEDYDLPREDYLGR
jgi:NAD+ synthase